MNVVTLFRSNNFSVKSGSTTRTTYEVMMVMMNMEGWYYVVLSFL